MNGIDSKLNVLVVVVIANICIKKIRKTLDLLKQLYL